MSHLRELVVSTVDSLAFWLGTEYRTIELHPVSTADEEWTKQARRFFTKRLYAQAALCFGKALQQWWRDVALAYEARRIANSHAEAHPLRQQAFSDVAAAFYRQAETAPSATDKQVLFQNAGKCYAEAQIFSSAADAFLKAENYSDAVWYYRKAGMFDPAITLIQEYTDKIDPIVAEKVTYVAKVVYAKDGKNE